MKNFVMNFTDKEKETYYFVRDIKSNIRKITQIIENINEPFIYDTNDINTQLFDIEYSVLRQAINDIVDSFSDKRYRIDKILDICDEDAAWTEERNKNYNYILYRKFTLKEEYKNKFLEILNKWLIELNTLAQELEAEEKLMLQEYNNRKEQFTIVQVFKLVNPKGGEDGIDGYWDGLLKNKDGETVRIVCRNVFDFGFYSYPKRLEGTKEIFEASKRNNLEILACKWINEFSPFTNRIRM